MLKFSRLQLLALKVKTKKKKEASQMCLKNEA